MRVRLIYATWPATPFGATWYKLPEAMRAAGLKEALVEAGHEVLEREFTASAPAATELRRAFELAATIADECRAAAADDALPVIVCGSCAVSAMAAMAAIAYVGVWAGVLWLDAHPDLNTPETSGSGMFDGMALATAMGLCWTRMVEEIAGITPGSAGLPDVCLVGARDVDPGEAALIAQHSIPTVQRAEDAVRHLQKCERVYVHLDMDVHDALQVRANSFAVPGGPSIEAVGALLAGATRQLPVAVLSVTGLDPAAPDAGRAIRAAIAHIRSVCDNWKPVPC
jgi:arginase